MRIALEPSALDRAFSGLGAAGLTGAEVAILAESIAQDVLSLKCTNKRSDRGVQEDMSISEASAIFHFGLESIHRSINPDDR